MKETLEKKLLTMVFASMPPDMSFASMSAYLSTYDSSVDEIRSYRPTYHSWLLLPHSTCRDMMEVADS